MLADYALMVGLELVGMKSFKDYYQLEYNARHAKTTPDSPGSITSSTSAKRKATVNGYGNSV